jgi:hypothetical protein
MDIGLVWSENKSWKHHFSGIIVSMSSVDIGAKVGLGMMTLLDESDQSNSTSRAVRQPFKS